ncbi:MAG: retropepsin-like aspartic protease [Gemmatimonadaceae bacterium]
MYLAALVFILPSCEGVGAPAKVTVPVDSVAGEISFRLAGAGGAAIAVPVYINGHGPVDLILDTGATLTCVDDELARELALPQRVGAIGVGASVGGTGPLRLVRVDSLRVGGARASDITVCALDLQGLRAISPNVHGLLGLNFLKSFRVTINFQRRILTLATP